MNLKSMVTWSLAIITLSSADVQASDSTIYQDSLTGFTFSQYLAPYSVDGKVIAYRIALPSDVPSGEGYDIVLQVVAPKDVGWAGLAWDSGMTGCPLIVAWAYGQSVTLTSRWANSHTLPTAYAGSSYELLRTGTRVNSTHWQFTAKCSGCTQFGGKTLSPTQSHRLAMAYCSQAPSNPGSNTSAFAVHTVQRTWDHDFRQGTNPSFSTLLVQSGVETS